MNYFLLEIFWTAQVQNLFVQFDYGTLRSRSFHKLRINTNSFTLVQMNKNDKQEFYSLSIADNNTATQQVCLDFNILGLKWSFPNFLKDEIVTLECFTIS